MTEDPQRRWRRDLHAFAAMIVVGIAVTGLAGGLMGPIIRPIDDPADYQHSVTVLLLPGVLAMLAMAVTWFVHPYLAYGHERWPFGPREIGGNGRRLVDVVLPNLLGFAVARFIPAPFAVVSGLYVSPETPFGVRVDAPVDVASRFVMFLASYAITWLVTFAIVQRVHSVWSARRVARSVAVSDAG